MRVAGPDPGPGADLTVRVDKQQLGRALVNLFDNADRHAGGVRAVTVQRVRDRVRIDVDDRGDGVPEGDRERIFERFVRAGSRGSLPAVASGSASSPRPRAASAAERGARTRRAAGRGSSWSCRPLPARYRYPTLHTLSVRGECRYAADGASTPARRHRGGSRDNTFWPPWRCSGPAGSRAAAVPSRSRRPRCPTASSTPPPRPARPRRRPPACSWPPGRSTSPTRSSSSSPCRSRYRTGRPRRCCRPC